MGPLPDLRGGAQARIGADDRVIRHPRPLQMAEGPDGRLAHHHAGPEHHKGLDHGTSGDLRVMAEHDGLRGRHGDARVQKPLPHPLLEGSLRLGQLGLAVHPHDRGLRREHGPHLQPPPAGQPDHVRQIVFLLGIVVADLGQQAEQQGPGSRQHAGIAQTDGQLLRRGVPGLDDPVESLALADQQPTIGAGIRRLEAEDGQVGTGLPGGEQGRETGPVQQRRVRIADQHVAIEIRQGLPGGQHGVTGTEGGILDHHRPVAQARHGMAGHLRRMGPGHHHDPGAARRLHGVDGPVQHGPSADAVQHLGHRRPHPRTLTCSQDHSRARSGNRHGLTDTH